MTSSPRLEGDPDPGPPPSAIERLQLRREELETHADAVDDLVHELADDADTLRSQEGWDAVTAAGAAEWASDRGNVFRALRRAHFNPAKAHAALLAALSARVERQLAGPIPSPPTSTLFTVLPPPCIDRLGHPVAVLTLRDVLRDDNGSLSDLKEWVWWGLELVRRTLHGHWICQGRGSGAEGAVLLVDASGAGYRNMEVELLPSLFSVGHDSFPGLLETVFVVNSGWTHRAMWNSLVRRVLPRSAIDKVVFLESKEDTEAFFDLDKLPKEYGGYGGPVDPEAMLQKYSHPRPLVHSRSRPVSRSNSRGPAHGHSRPSSRDRARSAPSRNTSTNSMAEVYYTANHTPISSRPGSRGPSRHGSHAALASLNPRLAMTKPGDEDKPSLSLDTISPMQRIKSLSDFHLYLSPSRLAHRDLLSDSEDDTPDSTPRHTPPPMLSPNTVQKRRTLRPALLEGSIAARRAASRARSVTPAPGVRAATPAEYASQLSAHHAKGLDQYCSGEQMDNLTRRDSVNPALEEAGEVDPDADPEPSDDSLSASTPETVEPNVAPVSLPAPEVQFSSANPWFGYPVTRSSDGTVRPRYGRNRKRDLVKTLLWLFLMRLQSWRDALERALGLHKLQKLLTRRTEQPRTPTEGLRRCAAERRGYGPAYTGGDGKAVTQKSHRDWIWMVIGFLLFRSSWTRLVGAPLEAVGMEAIRSVLGL